MSKIIKRRKITCYDRSRIRHILALQNLVFKAHCPRSISATPMTCQIAINSDEYFISLVFSKLVSRNKISPKHVPDGGEESKHQLGRLSLSSSRFTTDQSDLIGITVKNVKLKNKKQKVE